MTNKEQVLLPNVIRGLPELALCFGGAHVSEDLPDARFPSFLLKQLSDRHRDDVKRLHKESVDRVGEFLKTNTNAIHVRFHVRKERLRQMFWTHRTAEGGDARMQCPQYRSLTVLQLSKTKELFNKLRRVGLQRRNVFPSVYFHDETTNFRENLSMN
eukprot:PhM_4_TR11511/c0_g1_i1/m.40822